MIEVYTDGASRGNPGPSGMGIAIKKNKEIHEYSFFQENLSNHEAEFLAVIKALEICKKNFPEEILSFRTDSKVVVDTIEKDHTKNHIFSSFLTEIRELKKDFPYFFIKWIPEKENYIADRLAREIIRKEISQK
ncbi:ribonuclease HI family protein [Oceanobacillus sp. CAU 1775]